MNIQSRAAYAGRNLRRLTVAAATAFAVPVIVLNTAPNMEAAVFPVLADQQPQDVDRTDDAMTFSIFVRKLRQCPIASIAWSVVDDAGARRSIVVEGPNGKAVTGNKYLAPGNAILGPFRAVVTPDMNAFQRVEGVVHYQCHAGWLTEQILGPIVVQPLSARKARWQ